MTKIKKQKYQNTKVYKIKYDDRKINMQKTAPKDKLCQRCYDIIEWKLKFGKYKPLKQPGKCQKCLCKNIFNAYRCFCDKCCISSKICSKCGEKKDEYHFDDGKANPVKENDKKILMENYLQTLKESSKRKIYRLIGELKITWNKDHFIFLDTNLPVDGIKLKNKFKEETVKNELEFGSNSSDNE